MDTKKHLSDLKSTVDSNIIRYIPKGSVTTRTLYNAVRYSLTTGGKRIRPVLVLEACEAVSRSYKKAVPMAAAVEMIHTYTLIHDDLPSMDDDDIRRGLPTVHRKFGEDVAILAGDMLNSLAFEIIANSYKDIAYSLVRELAGAIGIEGVAGGQMADLEADHKKIGLKELEFISLNKTAKLFTASVRCGAIIGGANNRELSALTAFARHLGLAFQINDDILDYRQEQKNNYPALLGLKGSKIAADKELQQALNALPLKKEYGALRQTAKFLADRKA